MIKSKSTTRRLLTLILLLCLMASLMPVSALAAGGSTYYVSPTGSDTASGTSQSPWKTFAHAVSKMQSGDTLILKDGIYREELNVADKSNITFQAENKGGAVISACDPIEGWTLDSENIWKATVSSYGNVYNGDGNIVFADGILCQEARWPDLGAGKDGAHPLLNLDNYARVESGNAASPTIIDSDLAQFSSSDLEDAYVWCPGGAAYWSYISPIKEFNASANTIVLDADRMAYLPKQGNIYYVFGSKSLLSQEGEWHRDGDTLYMYYEGETAPVDVELRAREYTMRVDSADGITVDGISFRGGVVSLGEDTSDCTVANCTFDTVDYYMPRAGKNSQDNWKPDARGVVLNGTGSKVVNSEFRNLYGEGLLLYGDDNRVLNNYFHDYNFEATYADGVQIKGGSRHLISHNTFAHSGRSAIGGTFRKTVISYNDISDGGILTRDGGVVYLTNFDFDLSEFHHNVLRDSVNNEGMQYGFYMDSLTAGLNIYRNLIYGQENVNNSYSLTFLTNNHNIGNLFANNTFVNIGNPDYSNDVTQDHSQAVFVNNIFASKSTFENTFKLGSETDCNIEYFEDFTGAEANDYTPASSANAAIDKGKHIPGITDGFEGEAPDIGAFEYGAQRWDEKAGHDFSNSSYANEKYSLNTRIPYSNKVENNSFEYNTKISAESNPIVNSTFDGWTSDSEVYRLNQAAYSVFSSGNMYTKNGSYAAGVRKGQTLTQTITGLKPHTTYEVGAYAASMSRAYNSWDSDYPVVGSSAKLTNGNISGFVSGDTENRFCYDFDFEDDIINTIRFDVAVGSNAKANEQRKIEIYTAGDKTVDSFIDNNIVYDTGDDISGATLLATVDVSPELGKITRYDASWQEPISGHNKIYFKFIGDFYGVSLFKNETRIYLMSKSGEDKAVLRATSDSGETKEIEFTEDAGISDLMKTATVTTGSSGSIKVDLTKTEGTMIAFFDEVRLRESFAQNTYDESQFVLEYGVFDNSGTQMHSIKKDTDHTVKGSVEDINGIGGEVKFTLCSVYKDGTAFKTAEQTQTVPASGKLNFEITAKTPLSEDCYLTFLVETDSVATYTISDFTLSEQYNGSDIFADDFSIYKIADGVPVLIPSIAKGEFNMFEAIVRNRSAENVPFTGILALYDGTKLIDIMSINSAIDANDVDRFWLGTVIPDTPGLSVKLFTWENTNSLTPITEHKIFE